MRTLAALFFASLLVTPLVQGQGPRPAQDGNDPRVRPHTWVESDQTISLSPDLQRLFLEGTVRLHALNARPEMRFLCGDVCAAGDVRSFYRHASDEQRAFMTATLADHAERTAYRTLAAMAGSPDEVAVTARVVEHTLVAEDGPSPYVPTIDLRLFATAPTKLAERSDVTSNQIVSLFAMGAEVDVPITARAEPGHNLTLTLEVPEPLHVLGPGHGEPDRNGSTVQWSVSKWRARAPTDVLDAVSLGRPDVVRPAAPSAVVDVVLDLTDARGHLAGLVTNGAYATVDTRLAVEATVDAVEPPGRPPAGIALPALSADAVRLALGAGLVDRAMLDEREKVARRVVDRFLAEQLAVHAPVTGGWVNTSVAPGMRGDPIGTGPPLVLLLEANFSLDVPRAGPAGDDGGPGPSEAGARGLTVSTVPLTTITLPRLPALGPHETRLLIVLPDGVSLAYANATGVDVVHLKTADGHDAVLFSSNESQPGPAQVEGAALGVEHPAVWHLFWPGLLLGAVVVVGVPGAVVAWRRRHRTPPER